jgi:hypothetical protein
MTCADFQTRISPYLDGELSHWTRWKVQNHLRQCPECAARLEDLEDVDLCLREALTAQPAPQYLTDAVMHRLPAMPPVWRRTGGALTWSTGLAVLGMQLLALCGAYWWGYSRGHETGPPVDRTGILSPPATPLRAPQFLEESSREDVLPGTVGGVWGNRIDEIQEVVPVRQIEPDPSKERKKPKPAAVPPGGMFGPQLRLEGAR